MGEQEATESSTTVAHNNNFDQILNLFDLYWFHHSILRFTPSPTPPPVPPVPPESSLSERNTDDQSQLLLLPRPIQHRRTRSDETMSTTSSAPAPVLVKRPRLRTIPSGKEALTDLIQSSQVHVADVMEAAAERRRLSKSRMKRRSMSELELEELKGLLDLGFEFPDTEVEKDPRIADIVPGLRKRRVSEGGEMQVARRPYLSEAWRFRDDDERSRVLKDWTVLANGDERDVKEQLRRWAHVVASTVR